jgi:hypothetical protein
MATTTPNFGWSVPTSSDLVKNGATAIETLGDSIDASLVDLKGGTTGQVLAKASGTDMDFSWVAQDDSNAIQNALLTTTGDTIYASGASTPARLGIGSTGQVMTVAGGVPSWATPAASASGLTFITGATFSSAASVSFATGTFSATYKAYKVVFVIESGTIGAVLSSRFRTSGTDNSSANYYGRFYGIQANGTEVSVGGGGITSQACGIIEYTNNAPFFTFDISNPYASVRTDFAGSAVFCVSGGSNAFGAMAGFYNSTTSFDSMSFILASGSMSGYYKVYGYANS